MRQRWRRWPIQWCDLGLPISEWTFSRGNDKRPRRSARCKRPMPKNGGLSSRRPGSRENEEGRLGGVLANALVRQLRCQYACGSAPHGGHQIWGKLMKKFISILAFALL